MPSKKKKYNARFPAGRIKKIMQSDEEVGKVAQAVPVIISRTLELFVESLLTKTLKITNSRNAKTLSTSHMKQCIMSEQRFDFLRELVRNIPDISVAEEAANYNDEDNQSSAEEHYPDSDTPYDLSMPSTSLKAGRQQCVASNGHNGSGYQQHDYRRSNLKRSFSSNPSSVIRHTMALNQPNIDCTPVKYSRSDPTPVPQQLLAHQHPRLKHQPYSMPAHSDNNNTPNTNSYLKQLRPSSQQTAIPPPIVHIDFCNKPVVKIDYSNIAEMARSNNETPSSAPANIANLSSNNSAFDFSAEPVINIDLSNIVAPSATATISIGTPTLPTPLAPILPSRTSTSFPSSSPSNKTKLSSAKAAAADQQSRNSKASMAESLNSTSSSTVTVKATALAAAVAAATTMTAQMSAAKSDSYLEMDEDYDNI